MCEYKVMVFGNYHTQLSYDALLKQLPFLLLFPDGIFEQVCVRSNYSAASILDAWKQKN